MICVPIQHKYDCTETKWWARIASRYGRECPGIEFQGGRDFPHPSRLAQGPTQPPAQCVPWIKQTGHDADHSSSAEFHARSYNSVLPSHLI